MFLSNHINRIESLIRKCAATTAVTPGEKSRIIPEEQIKIVLFREFVGIQVQNIGPKSFSEKTRKYYY